LVLRELLACSRKTDLLWTAGVGIRDLQCRGSRETCRRPERHVNGATGTGAETRATVGGFVEVSGIGSSIRNNDTSDCRGPHIPHRDGFGGARCSYCLTRERQTGGTDGYSRPGAREGKRVRVS